MSHPSRAHLDAIGIPIWVRRRAAPAVGRADVPGATAGTEAAAPPAARTPPPTRAIPADQVPDTVDARVRESRRTGDPGATTGTEAAAPSSTRAIPAARALESIDAQVRECRKCELHRTRTHTVFGVGRPDAACMFIGEAPGAEEDARGEPFVGRAGKLLDAMLAAIGLGRGDVYIANIVKCRPPRNRDPHADEITACSSYLRRQIEAVAPRLLVATGRVAAQSLLSTTKSIGQLRGRTFRYGEDRLPVVVTYHPAYFLRSPLEKRKGWDDLLRLREVLREHGHEHTVGAPNAVAREIPESSP